MLDRGTHGCVLWRSIWKGWDDFSQYVRFEVGLGNRIRFWHDCWCGEQPLKVAFPFLFENAANQEVLVANLLEWQSVGKRELGCEVPMGF